MCFNPISHEMTTNALEHRMKLPNLQAHIPAQDSVLAFGAVTITSVVADLIAPVNVILITLFLVSIALRFGSGLFESYSQHRASGAKGKWYDSQRATYGLMKRLALLAFVPLAGIIDSLMMAGPATTAMVGELTPSVKAVLVGLTMAQVVGAARSLHAVLGDDALPGLNVIIRMADRSKPPE